MKSVDRVKAALEGKTSDGQERKSWTDSASANVLLENRAIAAQVCVKAGVELAIDRTFAEPDRALDFAEEATRRLMDVVDEFVRGERRKMARRKKTKEAAK